jgi:hypothetical protein
MIKKNRESAIFLSLYISHLDILYIVFDILIKNFQERKQKNIYLLVFGIISQTKKFFS